MIALRFPVDVLMRRVALANRWASERWQPEAVLPADPADAGGAPECVLDDAQGSVWRFRGHFVELHRSEGEGYFLNLESPSPSVFVMWRPAEDGAGPPVRPVVVTASYNEAARMLDAGEQVEPVPMAPEIRRVVDPFTRAHYAPEPRRKVRRNDPFADERSRGER